MCTWFLELFNQILYGLWNFFFLKQSAIHTQKNITNSMYSLPAVSRSAHLHRLSNGRASSVSAPVASLCSSRAFVGASSYQHHHSMRKPFMARNVVSPSFVFTLSLEQRCSFSSQEHRYIHDPLAVDFTECPLDIAEQVLGPSSPSSNVAVFPSVMTSDVEDKVLSELAPLLEKHGERMTAHGQTKSISLEMHGLGDETDAVIDPKEEISGGMIGTTVNGVTIRRDWAAGGRARRVFDLSWTPHLAEWCRTIGKDLLSTAGTQETIPDSVRVVEHHQPGDDFVVQPSCVGSQFLILNLCSPGIVCFDNESELCEGRVLLQEGACVRVSGALRWGWRVGQRAEKNQVFRRGSSGKSTNVDCSEFHISIMIFKYDTKMADMSLVAGAIAEKAKEHQALTEMKSKEQSTAKDIHKQNYSGAVIPPDLLSNSISGTDDLAVEEEEARAALAEVPTYEQSSGLSSAELQTMSKISDMFNRSSSTSFESASASPSQNITRLGGELSSPGAMPEELSNPAVADPLHDFWAYHKKPKKLDEAMEDVGDYRNRLARLGTFANRFQQAQSQGGWNKEEIAQELRQISGDDSLSAAVNDPRLQALSYDAVADKAEYVLKKFKNMDYFGGDIGDQTLDQRHVGYMKLRSEAETLKSTAANAKDYFRAASEGIQKLSSKR